MPIEGRVPERPFLTGRLHAGVIAAGGLTLITPSAYHSTMPLNIKDPETERLAREVAELTGESKTGAVRTALRERRERLALQRAVGDRQAALRALLEREVWPSLPAGAFGQAPSQGEQDEILGYIEPGR